MNKKIRKIISAALAAAIIASMLGTTACNMQEQVPSSDASSKSEAAASAASASDSEATTATTTTATETTEATTATTETTRDPSAGTPETTLKPPAATDEIMLVGDKEFFTPFKDPAHSYCSINDGFGAPLREQGWGGCYAYSAVTCMQVKYLKDHGELIDLNPVDIIDRIYEGPDMFTGEEPEQDEEKIYISSGLNTDLAGEPEFVNGSLVADPLNGCLLEEGCFLGTYKVDIPFINKLKLEDVKDAIKEYGALSCLINYQKGCKTIRGYYTQNYQDNGNDTDHLATIIGWDDNFPKEGFKTPASRNGAWLVQNSFGEFWGNMGYYWISYDMPLPGIYSYKVTKDYSSAVSYGKYADAYVISPDIIKKAGKVMNPSKVTMKDMIKADEVISATVYDVPGTIAAIGINTLLPNQPYTIEILDGEFGEVLATMKGKQKRIGYHTVKLDTPVKAEKYTVVVKLPGEAAFEGAAEDINVYTVFQKIPARYAVTTEPGRSFIKIKDEWVDVTEPDIKSRLGLDGALYFDDFTEPGDPCITVLFE